MKNFSKFRSTLICATLALPVSLYAQANTSCADLKALQGSDVVITEVQAIAAGTLATHAANAGFSGQANVTTPLPAFCEVQGIIHKRMGAEGKTYGSKFDLRMPQPWNGGFIFQGGGGMDGVLGQALGANPVNGSTAKAGLQRGYAVVATDGGHTGTSSADSSFALDQQARLDFAYASIGDVTREARVLIAAYYGQDPKHSYFMGCSNGGREALMAAQRYPLEFDGIVAGDPGFHLSHAAIGEAWDTSAFLKVAPKNTDGKPILANAFSKADLDLVSTAVLNKCDAADGVKDGSIEAMRSCHFDPEVLLCKDAKNAACLTVEQVGALHTVFSGAHDSHGNRLYASWPWDAGINGSNWRSWKVGTSQTAEPNAINASTGTGSLSTYFKTPPESKGNEGSVNFDMVEGETAQTAAINDATSTMLQTFFARGGKMIVFEGNSDPVFSADDLKAYWEELAHDNGGDLIARRSARLFLVPGMNHCGGGPALDNFDPLTALEQWTATGNGPERIEASGKAFPGRSRPLCPYPLESHYNGTGNTQDSKHFTCKQPVD
jgi:poly(3-hydroxybutyrate) depolymerase